LNTSTKILISRAQAARDEGQWLRAVELYGQLSAMDQSSAEIEHNLGLSLLGLGKPQEALLHCARAIELKPIFWQSHIIMSKAYQQLDQITKAHESLKSVLKLDYKNAPARLGLADLALNQYGDPYGARAWVKLIEDPEYLMDVKLTSMMAKLYDRPHWHDPKSAIALTEEIKSFSAEYLRLPNLQLPPLVARSAADPQRNPRVPMRPRVGLLSPLFSASPVYFLTFSKWKKMANYCDLILFNRGHKADWATAAFKDLASEWLDVQHMSAEDLARSLYKADLDVLYDLGGWMDPIGIKALSVKPARQLFKWVGGQSVTTGLSTFDGWVGDEANSPIALQHLY
jgi:predicted O-linked N-acetylglucosamine transferase (SPINDLY family)